MPKFALKATSFIVLILSILLLSACNRSAKDAAQEAPKNDKRWPQYIAEHSAGMQSRSTQIRIRFVNDVVSENEVGKPVEGVLDSEPLIKGSVVFNNPRELLLVPEAPLSSGQHFNFKLKAQKLPSLPQNLGDFVFAIDVMPQSASVTVGAVFIDPAQADRMIVKGEINTVDVADADAVEKMLTASYVDQPVALLWTHDSNGRRHEFKTASLQRGDESRQLSLQWDSAGIGAKETGKQDINIAGRGQFNISSVDRMGGDQQHIKVHFSELLDAHQNLSGLISLSSGEFTSKIENNSIAIFPTTIPNGDITVNLSGAIRAADGRQLGSDYQRTLSFESIKPQVRFIGQGVILPDAEKLTIPFEAVNVASVQVTAFRVFDKNLGQFLQVNPLNGTRELNRVGRFIWRKTINLNAVEANKWMRLNFDASELFRHDPGGLFRLEISINRGNSIYACTDAERAVPLPPQAEPKSADDYNEYDSSGWDFADNEYYYDYYGGGNEEWQQRDNPCKDGYYRYGQGIKDSRNFVAANIGILAKAGSDNTFHFATTNIRSGDIFSGVTLRLFNYQNTEITKVESDSHGLVSIKPEAKPFYVMAEKDGQRGYLKLSDGLVLPVSHFDVGGVSVQRGVKGTIFGERGVWRPGDKVYLTFVLQDELEQLPPDHPATLELINPQNQLVYSQTNTKPVGDFYAFTVQTQEKDLTGNWTARVRLGARNFERSVKIETVMPNRLKIELDTGGDRIAVGEDPTFKLFSQWLTGANAGGLKADVAVRLKPRTTKFDRATDYVFDDPTRKFDSSEQMLFEGNLDANGNAQFNPTISAENASAGILTADFTTRVFEPGGAFSIGGQTATYYPYEHYIGIKLPKGDAARQMLLTDTSHTVDIATLDANGKPVNVENLQLSLYKIEWRWWWEQSGNGVANFNEGEAQNLLQQDTVSSKDGRASWQFQVKYPDWGRYLVRACDLDGGHCTGQITYIDWPGWAGRAQEQKGPGANALTLYADKASYQVGETATIHLPPAQQGRALLSIENGTHILQQEWLELDGKRDTFSVAINNKMTPNIYVSVTLLQPHQNKNNDRPIRLYGVMPLSVTDPATHLTPVLQVADEVRPETTMKIGVSEKQGHAMTYMLAVVDEGLLGLTNFKTPQLHDEFFRREALGVRSWDMFDDVVGAYGGELEKLLALGGSDDAGNKDANKDKKRFPPVVKVLGPFQLEKGKSANHEIELPPYVGAVRAMVIAGDQNAYGSAEKSVFVRAPLMLQATLPRVLGPNEELRVPVAIFALSDQVKDVALSVKLDKKMQLLDNAAQKIHFDHQGDKLGFIKMKVGPTLGKTAITFSASSGKEKAEQTLYVEIRAPNASTTTTQKAVVKPGDKWAIDFTPHGLAGSNQTMLEVSSVPPLNLSERLQYLIQYPHGCVEQTTSGAFPQLYLNRLMQLDENEQRRAQSNVNTAIERLRMFQQSNGGFGYWPGDNNLNSWSSNYVGHFLIEAQRLGFSVPANMLSSWKNFQKSRAQQSVTGNPDTQLDQSYRLYTLALAGSAELGAMNRLREVQGLTNVARWQLAAAYKLVGLNDIALDLIKNADLVVPDFKNEAWSWTYGSQLRDQAILLDALVGLKDDFRAKDMAETISDDLNKNYWYSTQSVSWSLLALSHFVGDGAVKREFKFDHALRDGGFTQTVSTKPVTQLPLALDDKSTAIKFVNRSDVNLYVSVSNRGLPEGGSETASSDSLSLTVDYSDKEGKTIAIDKVKQGSDIRARVTIKNTSGRELQNLALTQIVPSGWEILNTRDAATGSEISESAYDYRDFRDDRVHTYFNLKAGESRSYVLQFNAAYPGKYYFPGWNVEAMYDAKRHARVVGQWVNVVEE